MNIMSQLSAGTSRQKLAGKAVGILVGSIGLLLALAVLFIPVLRIVGPGAVDHMAGIEYLLGNPAAEKTFHQAIFMLLVSLSVIYMIATDGIRTLWLTTGIIGIAGIGGLQYGGNTGKILLAVALLLALSAALLTVSHSYER